MLKFKSVEKWWYSALLALIIVLSVLAMVNGIFSESLLMDESFFARNLDQFPQGFYIQSAPSAPLFYVTTYCLISILGNGEFVYRLIPVVSAIAGLIITALFISKRFSKFVSLVAVFLLSTSTVFVHYAGYAHPYTTDFFCSILLLYLVLKYYENPSQKRWLIIVGVSIISLLFSFTAFFVVASFGLFVFSCDILNGRSKDLVRKLFSALPLIVVMVLLIIFVYTRHTADRTDMWYWNRYFPAGVGPLAIIKFFYRNTISLLGYFFWNSQNGLIGLFLVILGTAYFIGKKKFKLCALCWFPIIVTLIASFLQKWPYGPVRTMLFSMVFFLILIGGGLELIWQRVNSHFPRIAVAAALVVLVLPQSWTLKQGFVKIHDSHEAFRTMSEGIRTDIEKNDRFLVYYGAETRFRYYFHEYVDRAVFQDWKCRENPELLAEFVRKNLKGGRGRFWMIFSTAKKTEEDVMISAAQEYATLVKKYTFPGCSAFLFNQ